MIDYRSISSRASSASLTDDDAITPCVEERPAVPVLPVHPVRSATAPLTRPASTAHPDTARIWRRMLALQRRYHCYNSARISAALESELVEAVVPPRACLDLLNDGAVAQALPDEARRAVAALVSGEPEYELCDRREDSMDGSDGSDGDDERECASSLDRTKPMAFRRERLRRRRLQRRR